MERVPLKDQCEVIGQTFLINDLIFLVDHNQRRCCSNANRSLRTVSSSSPPLSCSCWLIANLSASRRSLLDDYQVLQYNNIMQNLYARGVLKIDLFSKTGLIPPTRIH